MGKMRSWRGRLGSRSGREVGSFGGEKGRLSGGVDSGGCVGGGGGTAGGSERTGLSEDEPSLRAVRACLRGESARLKTKASRVVCERVRLLPESAMGDDGEAEAEVEEGGTARTRPSSTGRKTRSDRQPRLTRRPSLFSRHSPSTRDTRLSRPVTAHAPSRPSSTAASSPRHSLVDRSECLQFNASLGQALASLSNPLIPLIRPRAATIPSVIPAISPASDHHSRA